MLHSLGYNFFFATRQAFHFKATKKTVVLFYWVILMYTSVWLTAFILILIETMNIFLKIHNKPNNRIFVDVDILLESLLLPTIYRR